MDDFEWRLSTALVERDGRFSVFEGIDRRLYVLEGAGLELQLGPGRSLRLENGDHIDFQGELSVFGGLIEGPVVDLNIMVRRDKQRAHIGEFAVSGPSSLAIPWKTAAILVRSGHMEVVNAGSKSVVNRLDAVILDKHHPGVLPIDGSAELIIAGFDPL